MSSLMSPFDLRSILRAGSEVALIDVREEGLFVEGHLFHARNVPLASLSSRIGALVPRKGVLIVVMDGGKAGETWAADAAEVLAGLGYPNVSVLAGGIAGWAAAGNELFSGTHVPSKAFGEFVALSYRTPHITASALSDLLTRGADVVVLDVRTFEEYRDMSIPSAVSVPGEDLVQRVYDLAPSPQTLVVVNCAGRTRSIIGAQSLIDAGVANRVAALEDGTSGWQLAGLKIEHGAARRAPAPSREGLSRARESAARIARQFGVQALRRADLADWQERALDRTLYMLDVRSPSEFRAGHVPGSRNAPGGQLIQATDSYIGVLGARIVLIDEDQVRATLAAAWLMQMGWKEVTVLADGLAGPLVKDLADEGNDGRQEVRAISPISLDGLMRSSLATIVLDVSPLELLVIGHIPGAHRIEPGAAASVLGHIANCDAIVVAGESETAALSAASALLELAPSAPLHVLSGGMPAWIDAGLPVERGLGRVLCEQGAWEMGSQHDPVARELRKYLTWEVGLVEQIKRSGEANFRYFPRDRRD